MRLLIIGSSGFIGSNLVSAAAAQNFKVTTLSRSGILQAGAEQSFPWEFGQLVPDKACEGIDCVIYLAHDFDGEDGAHRTIDSTLEIASQLQAVGVTRQLFFSSYSAGKHASSLYGRTKFTLEQKLIELCRVVIVRPGLVLGEGGIYGRIRKWARVMPFVPLPDGGHGKVPIIAIEKLCDLTLGLVLDKSLPNVANLFEPQLKSLRELVLETAAEVGHRPWIVHIPATLLFSILKLAFWLHLPIPVNADSLAGFIANQSAQHSSTIES